MAKRKPTKKQRSQKASAKASAQAALQAAMERTKQAMFSPKGRSTFTPQHQPRTTPLTTPAPRTTTTPATPGVRRPALTPFLTPEQQISDVGQRADWSGQLGELDRTLEKLAADTTYQKQQLNKTSSENAARVNDNAIARGMFTSSVRDAELYDLEATKTIRSNFLDDQVKLTTLQTQSRKSEIAAHQTAYQNALNKMQVENAAKASEGLSPWITEPTPARTTTAPAKPTTAPKPVVKGAPSFTPVKVARAPAVVKGNTAFKPRRTKRVV